MRERGEEWMEGSARNDEVEGKERGREKRRGRNGKRKKRN